MYIVQWMCRELGVIYNRSESFFLQVHVLPISLSRWTNSVLMRHSPSRTVFDVNYGFVIRICRVYSCHIINLLSHIKPWIFLDLLIHLLSPRGGYLGLGGLWGFVKHKMVSLLKVWKPFKTDLQGEDGMTWRCERARVKGAVESTLILSNILTHHGSLCS